MHMGMLESDGDESDGDESDGGDGDESDGDEAIWGAPGFPIPFSWVLGKATI